MQLESSLYAARGFAGSACCLDGPAQFKDTDIDFYASAWNEQLALAEPKMGWWTGFTERPRDAFPSLLYEFENETDNRSPFNTQNVNRHYDGLVHLLVNILEWADLNPAYDENSGPEAAVELPTSADVNRVLSLRRRQTGCRKEPDMAHVDTTTHCDSVGGSRKVQGHRYFVPADVHASARSFLHHDARPTHEEGSLRKRGGVTFCSCQRCG